ncbi:MAG: electron transport complex subunit RsxE [Firmicutes bacterium]|nr:electron transport complex subunit RsxE [Bacillota bacterium]
MFERADLTRGLVTENPLLKLMIGLCSALAVSTRVENAMFMGVAVIFVLTLSNIVISVLRRVIPDNVRIPIFIVVISSFVTIVDLSLRAYFPGIYSSLGVWIPLIVVNCIILGRAEAFAYHKGILASTLDGLGMGVGYTLVLLVMGLIRELSGTGGITMLGVHLISLGSGFQAPTFMISFPGAFLVFGLLMGALNKAQMVMAERAAKKSSKAASKAGTTAAAGGV